MDFIHLTAQQQHFLKYKRYSLFCPRHKWRRSKDWDLQGGARGRQRGESDDVAEVDGHRVEALGLHRNPLFQVFGDRSVKNESRLFI